MLPDDVALDEREAALDLALGLGAPAVECPDAQPGQGVLEVGLPAAVGTLELRPPIAQERAGEAVLHEGPVAAGEDVDLVLAAVPASRQQEAAVVLEEEDQVEPPEMGAGDLEKNGLGWWTRGYTR